MAVSFPRGLPGQIGFADCQFTLVRYQNRNEPNGGLTQVTEYAEPRWRVMYATTLFRLRHKHRLESWWNSLQGGLQTFLGYDVLRPKPYAYRNIAIPSLAGATLTAVAGDHLSFAGLPASFELNEGDWIELRKSGDRGLYQVREDRTASGGTMTVEVDPSPLTTVFDTSSVFDFDQPQAEFLPEVESFDIQRTGSMFSARWSGIQKLL